MSRTLLATVAGLALAVAGAAACTGPAQAAAPVDPAAAQPFTVACSTGVRATITLPVPGSSLPGSVIGRDASFLPYRFDYRWTDGQGRVTVRSEARGEPGPVPRSAVRCRLAPVAFPDGTFFSFTVVGAVRSDG